MTNDLNETSPTPWGAWDKHSVLYDADGDVIATFGSGGKALRSLNDRNRAAVCVNALEGIDNPSWLVQVARKVGHGELPPEVLLSVLDDRPDFEVRGPGLTSEGEVRVEKLTIRRASFMARSASKIRLIHTPSGALVQGST